jgi:hypothetical protein
MVGKVFSLDVELAIDSYQVCAPLGKLQSGCPPAETGDDVILKPDMTVPRPYQNRNEAPVEVHIR